MIDPVQAASVGPAWYLCLLERSLDIGGRSGQGAIEDNGRIAEFIYRNREDGHPLAHKNTISLEKLLGSGYVLIAGQELLDTVGLVDDVNADDWTDRPSKLFLPCCKRLLTNRAATLFRRFRGVSLEWARTKAVSRG